MSEVESIEAVLAAHEYQLGRVRGSVCACQFVPEVDPVTLQTQQDYHRAHVATVLAARDDALRRQAWDEGCDFGIDYERGAQDGRQVYRENPYAAATYPDETPKDAR